MRDSTRGFLTGLGAGAGIVAILPFAMPVLTEVVRPLTKAFLKQSMLGGDRLRTLLAHVSEALEDLLAEVRAEVAQELDIKSKPEANGMHVVSPADGGSSRAQPEKVVS
jgi:hypothetical protein